VLQGIISYASVTFNTTNITSRYVHIYVQRHETKVFRHVVMLFFSLLVQEKARSRSFNIRAIHCTPVVGLLYSSAESPCWCRNDKWINSAKMIQVF
jgi:hypothetical protein